MRPFLENVTRGRGVPPERLDDVARALPAFRRRLADQRDQPRADRADPGRARRARHRSAGVLRQPQLGALRRGHRRGDARRRRSPGRGVHDVGVGRVLQLHAVPRGHRAGPPAAGTARPSWSSCASTSTTRCWWRCSPTAIARGRATLPDAVRDGARLVFTAHSIPVRRRLAAAARTCTAAKSRTRRGWWRAAAIRQYDQVWQSRSGPPQVPWLEPDVADHLTTLAAEGTGR